MSSSGSGDSKDPSTWEKSESKFTGKRYSEYFDPCQEAADRSLKCLRRNGGDRAMCTDYFEYDSTLPEAWQAIYPLLIVCCRAYKECKKSWMEEMKQQKQKKGNGWFG